MVFMGMAPFGSLLAGAAAAKVGAPWTLCAAGAVAMAAAGVFFVRLPRIRSHARRLISEQQIVID